MASSNNYKRKLEGSENGGRKTGFSDGPPAMDEVEIAKQRAQEIVARLVNTAEAKRPRIDDDSARTAIEQKPPSLSIQNLQYGDLSSMAQQNQPSDFQGSSRKFDVPNSKVGLLIGKGGETIKYLQQNSGCKIQITRDADADPFSSTREVELIGPLDRINKAEQLIKDIIAQADVGVSGAQIARGFSSLPAGGEQIQIQVPNNKVGLIIGRGGETIKNLQSRSGARVQLIPLHLPEGDTSTSRTLQLTGNTNQIEAAQEMIKDIISEILRVGGILYSQLVVLFIVISSVGTTLVWSGAVSELDAFVLKVPCRAPKLSFKSCYARFFLVCDFISQSNYTHN